ncbi:MAG: Gfo/Idh/MocA family protein [Angustibacter sp.]
MRVGVVGAGGIAAPHLAAWQQLGVSASVFSLDDAAGLAGAHGAEVLPSLDALLEACDVVDVCTPTFTHREIVLAAAAAGRHVICEKPLSLRRDEAVEMIEACDAAGVQLHPGQVVRYFPEYVAAKQAVDDGRIGVPAVLRFSRRGARPNREWFARPELSGGIVVDQMIHDIDFARWVAGGVEQVMARVVGAEPGPTLGIAVLTHASGALSHLVGGWGHPDEQFRTEFSLAGSSGLVRHSSLDVASLRWSVPGAAASGGELLPAAALGTSPFVAELAEFWQACAGGPPPRVGAHDSLVALEIALAATESARTGRPVLVKEVAA